MRLYTINYSIAKSINGWNCELKITRCKLHSVEVNFLVEYTDIVKFGLSDLTTTIGHLTYGPWLRAKGILH